MQWHDWFSMNPKGPMPHLSLSPCTGSRLPVAARIKFKTLITAYRTATGSAPSYFHSLVRIYIPSRSLRSASEQRLVVHHREAQHHFPGRFHSLFLAGGMNFPPLSGMLNPWQFQATPETYHLFHHHLTHLKKKKKPLLSSLTSPCLASIFSEQCLKLCIASTSCSLFPLYNESLIVFLNCKSLWIKASAK